jgi:hypothetical protein
MWDPHRIGAGLYGTFGHWPNVGCLVGVGNRPGAERGRGGRLGEKQGRGSQSEAEQGRGCRMEDERGPSAGQGQCSDRRSEKRRPRR